MSTRPHTDGIATDSALPDGRAHQRWPAERFYWALLSAPPEVKVRGGRLPPGLLSDLADQLPVPLEQVHAVCAQTPGGLLACAAQVEDLQQLPASTLRVTPEQPPHGIGGAKLVLEQLNLLTGPFEPRHQRSRRARLHLAGLAAKALLAGLVSIGFARRAAYWNALGHEASGTAATLLKQHLPPGLPPQALAAEVARLQHASMATAKIAPPPDAALSLASILAAWPTAVAGTPQSISVTESGISITVLFAVEPTGSDRTQEFLRAFVPPGGGWAMHEPRLTGGKDFTRVDIDLYRVRASASETGGAP